MSAPVYLGIDLGTQSVRVLAVTEDGALVASASHSFDSYRDGVRHEQSPEDWWRSTALCCRRVVHNLDDAEVLGLAVDATSGTILLLNEALAPLGNALMYDDGRAQLEAEDVNRAGAYLWEQLSYRMQPSWALPKLLWLSRNGMVRRGVKLAHQNDFVHLRLAGRILPTDSSNALKTGYDMIHNRWAQEIMDNLQLELDLPDVVSPGTHIGKTSYESAEETGLRAGTPIYAGMTDGCAAQIASGAISPGNWSSVIGTTLVLKGVSSNLLHDPLGVMYSHRSADKLWLPGGASSCGAGLIAREFETNELESLNAAALSSGPSGVVVYPLVGRGERYPFAAPDAHGFTLGEPNSRVQQYTATLEGIACVERLALDSLKSIGALTNGNYTISGGATKSVALNRLRAEILERPVSIPLVTESAFGMAVLAAASASSIREAVERMVKIERIVEPVRNFSLFAPQYARMVTELRDRGWLPKELAAEVLLGGYA
jgi:D-ribulokinase